MTENARRLAWGCSIAAVCLTAASGAPEQEQAAALLSLRFPGGTALEYAAAVRRAAGDLNVVIAPEAEEVQMPPVELTRVTAAAALDLLDGRTHTADERRVELHVRPGHVYDPLERATYQVIAEVAGRPPRSRAHVCVWTMSRLLESDVPSTGVLAAVEMALDVVGSKTKMDVRFHEDTGLLIATGDEAQLKAIDQVVGRLNDSVAERLDNPTRKLQAALEACAARCNDADARLAEAEQARKSALDNAMALQMEIQRVEMRAREFERMLDMRQRELDRVTSELRKLEAERQGRQGREGAGGNPSN